MPNGHGSEKNKVIDTAEFYQNETGVGVATRRALESEGLSRSDIFVTTKLWPRQRSPG
jgi:diketogulonate reductase-like aldo/keto reductase